MIGKPSAGYFGEGLALLGTSAGETLMCGDDIASDVGGAQRAGLRGVQVRGEVVDAQEDALQGAQLVERPA